MLVHMHGAGEQHAAGHDARCAEQQRRRPAAAGRLPDRRLLLRSPRALPTAPRLRGRGCRGAEWYVLQITNSFAYDLLPCCRTSHTLITRSAELVTEAHPFQKPIGCFLYSPKCGGRFR